ncbi:MAG: MATE family efflux transporter [Solobacterium sp.]|nr:MATE family efflux transporter [Solobacterium sp.]
MRRQADLLHGVIWKQILIFFWPVLFGTLFQQLYNTVDAVIVGNYVGKEALGAVGGSTGTVINLLVGFVTGLSCGATVVIAQCCGKNDHEGVRRGVDSGMFMALFLGIILTAAGILTAPWILRILNVPDAIYGLSLIYMQLYFIGMVPTLIYNTGSAILRAVGDSRRPLYFLIVSAVINIILDILFVAVLKMSVSGAALATVIAQSASCLMTLRVLRAASDSYHFDFKTMRFDMKTMVRIIAIGFPTGIQSCLYSVANLFIQSSVNSYGTDVVAAYTAFGKIDALFWNYSGALGTSLLTFTGQNFGAGDLKRVKKGILQGIGIDIAGSLLITAVCFFGGIYMFRMFTDDAGVIEAGVSMLKYLCPYWVTFAGVEILSSSIRSCGDSFVPMCMTAVGIGALRIIWILFYPSENIFDTLRCYPISWIVTSLLFVIYYLEGSWLKRSLKQREKILTA